MAANPDFLAELDRYGPGSLAAVPSVREAQEYCRQLALRHYENFTVASYLLPRELRPHFYHVYAYCRWSDDLADETGDADHSQKLLAWWEEQLAACYAGQATHPVFVALRGTIEEFEIPREPFANLLIAFRQDQHTTRYETHAEVLDYCVNSANPVGRLVLYLGRAFDETRAALSDSVCTGLQLANFCQDVANDWGRGRVYLPQEECRRFGITEGNFANGQPTPAFRELLKLEVDRADSYLRAGFPLVPMLPRHLQLDIELFIRGGLAILAAIRGRDYDVWTTRPKVSKQQQLLLLGQCWWNRLYRRPASPTQASLKVG